MASASDGCGAAGRLRNSGLADEDGATKSKSEGWRRRPMGAERPDDYEERKRRALGVPLGGLGFSGVWWVQRCGLWSVGGVPLTSETYTRVCYTSNEAAVLRVRGGRGEAPASILYIIYIGRCGISSAGGVSR